MNQYNPDYISPPGDTIAELMEERGIAISEVLEKTGLEPEKLLRLMTGDNPIGRRSACKLTEAFGTPAKFWIERSRIYQDLWQPRPAEWRDELVEARQRFSRFFLAHEYQEIPF